ncbi:lysozyme [Candidatus Magnetomoraceae bacterium gMMP-15]
MNMEAMKQQLEEHEGLRLKPYRDTVGHITIGVGRNLDAEGISKDEAMILLENDINKCIEDLKTNFSFFDELSENRQKAIVDMRFNLGHGGFRRFKSMINALEEADYSRAADEMLNSKWADEVPERAKELAAQMMKG